ncbi:hypothetical protein BJY04DRAFT_189841 [Aspergillus karnatakaensis]|uniref:uncharacterized protein n=1 Tax=Aspergillus karnatakaensis TaxID=1810916 RepID=UPI003CCE471C
MSSCTDATRASSSMNADLYNRAISGPSLLTDEERRLITYRPPRDEESELCQSSCGLSMDQLVQKAISSKDNRSIRLSCRELDFLTPGGARKEFGRIISEVARLSPEDRVLKGRALNAVLAHDFGDIVAVVQREKDRRRSDERAAAQTLSFHDIKNICVSTRIPWQKHVLQSNSASAGDLGTGTGSGTGPGHGDEDRRFGLVVFYPVEEEKERRFLEYKPKVEQAVHNSLNYSHSLIDETRDLFTLHWAAVPSTNDIMGQGIIHSVFEEIPIGFRRDAFLYIDEEALRSLETSRPYLWLSEPGPQLEANAVKAESKNETEIRTGAETGGQPRPLKVDIKHIAPALFARLVQRDLKGEERSKPYRRTSELKNLHAANEWANGD